MLHRYDMAAAALSSRHGTIQAPPPRCQSCQCDESAQPQATQSCRVTRSAGGDPRALGREGAKSRDRRLAEAPF